MSEVKSAFPFIPLHKISTGADIPLSKMVLPNITEYREVIANDSGDINYSILPSQKDAQIILEGVSRRWSKAVSIITSGRDLTQEINKLKNMYTLRRSEEVSAFLSENEKTMRILADAHKKIRKYFPTEDILLEIFSDPSSPKDKEILVSISTTLAPEEAIRKLDMFDDEWWDVDSNTPGLNLCVKVEYK